MRTITTAALAMALVGLVGLAPTPARAGCNEEIQSLEGRLAASTGNPRAERVAAMIAKSKNALTANRTKKCEQIVAEAVATFEDGESKAARGADGGGGKAAARECLAKIPDLEKRLALVPQVSSRRTSVADAIASARTFGAKGRKERCEHTISRVDRVLHDIGY